MLEWFIDSFHDSAVSFETAIPLNIDRIVHINRAIMLNVSAKAVWKC